MKTHDHERPEGNHPMPSTEASGCPAGAGRRSFVRTALGASAAGAALAGGGFALSASGGTAEAQAADTPGAAKVPFHGAHQAGILTPAPAAATFVSFDVITDDRAQLVDLLRGHLIWGLRIREKPSHLVQSVPVLRVVRFTEYRYDPVQAGDAAKQAASTLRFELAAVLDPDEDPGCGVRVQHHQVEASPVRASQSGRKGQFHELLVQARDGLKRCFFAHAGHHGAAIGIVLSRR
ncbi:hypothetical protein OIE50_07180 [Streptomyces canus]|uniref:hypothetical protein n=1 Tax=Streptomyces canus TaxID=58343 RepID=UPI0032489878